MKHKFNIWTRYKGKNNYISHHIEMSESELEILALNLFKAQYQTDDDCEYEARLDETII